MATTVAPKLSIGIPVYNGGKFLKELLENLRKQTFQDFEIVICDNASTDDTREICLQHAKDETRLRYYRNDENLGANPNFNKVFELARAPLFKWAAHDDLYQPNFLETCIRLLDENPDALLAHSDCLCIDELCRPFPAEPQPFTYVDPRSGIVFQLDPSGIAGSRWPVVRFCAILFRMRWSMPIFGVIRREALARTGLFRNFYGADKLVLAELSLLGRFVYSTEKLYLKRFHSSMSWALSLTEASKWVKTSRRSYSLRRLRQLIGFGSAPFGKSLSPAEIAACLMLIPLVIPSTIVRALRGSELRRQLQSARATSELFPI